jgi:hypothetical protein
MVGWVMKFVTFAFGLACAVSFLAGCATDTAKQQANDAAIAAADDAACLTYGPAESKAYVQCRANRSLTHDRQAPTPGAI